MITPESCRDLAVVHVVVTGFEVRVSRLAADTRNFEILRNDDRTKERDSLFHKLCAAVTHRECQPA